MIFILNFDLLSYIGSIHSLLVIFTENFFMSPCFQFMNTWREHWSFILHYFFGNAFHRDSICTILSTLCIGYFGEFSPDVLGDAALGRTVPINGKMGRIRQSHETPVIYFIFSCYLGNTMHFAATCKLMYFHVFTQGLAAGCYYFRNLLPASYNFSSCLRILHIWRSIYAASSN